MKTPIIFIILIVSLISCQPKESKKGRFSFNKISQTAFSWVLSDSSQTGTFYISQYIECDSNGYCLIAKRDSFKSPLRYFEAKLPVDFDTLLNNIDFAKLDTSYLPKENESVWYCGDTYCFTIEDKEHFTKYIKIRPSHIDPLIIKLVKSFDGIAFNAKKPAIDTINLNPISNYIQKTLEDTSKLPKRSTLIFKGPNTD